MLHFTPTTTTPVAANDSNIAATKPSTLLPMMRAAKFSFTNLSNVVGSVLDGQRGPGQRAYLAGYIFTIGCMESPADAAKLPGWDNAAVQANANPYYQPLKMVAKNINSDVQTKISLLAKVYRDAHKENIAPEQFLEHLKRKHGLRRWYDSVVLAEKAANGNVPNGGSGKSHGGGGRTANKQRTGPVDVVQLVADANNIAYAIIDKDMLICDSATKADLESNPAVLGFVLAANDDCRAFLNDNDSRFTKKGAA